MLENDVFNSKSQVMNLNVKVEGVRVTLETAVLSLTPGPCARQNYRPTCIGLHSSFQGHYSLTQK